MSCRENQVTSAAAADNCSVQARLRPRRRISTATITAVASTTAPISHHNHAGGEVVLVDVATTPSVCVAAGVAGSGVGAAETVRGGVAGWVGVAAGVRDGRTPDRDGDADRDGRTEPL